MQRFHCWSIAFALETSGQGSDLEGLLQEALRYLQPIAGCSAEGWWPFLPRAPMFNTPFVSRGTDYSSCFGECTWNGGNVGVLNCAFPAGILRAAYVKLMLLATIFTVGHLMVSYLLSSEVAVDFSQGCSIRYTCCIIFRGSDEIAMHQIILSWAASHGKVPSYFKLHRTLEPQLCPQ